MLTKADNETLTKTGPGTAMGNLIRRFWLPALVPSELPAPDCPPIRFRIASEDLVAFRDSTGKVGFVANACPHRGASLFFGRNEEAGLRCVYHGWKFDTTGACIDMPSEPAESNFKSKVRVKSYPAAEHGGLVWIYMGPPEKQPELPQFDWTLHQDEHPNLKVYKWLQDCNYSQGVESFLDTAHISFLHRNFKRGGVGSRNVDPNTAPSLELQETDFGFVYGGRRPTLDGRYYWRITAHIQPWFSEIPSQTWDGSGSFVVPQDDEHSWWFTVSPTGVRAAAGAPEREHVVLIPGTFRQTNNADNDYLIDREKQRTENYTGMAGNRVEDSMVTETMGPIYDRSQEHLGTTDRAVIFWRRQLIRWARDLENGIEPPMLNDASLFRARPIDIITDEPEMLPIWHENRRRHLSEEIAPMLTVPQG